MAMNLIYAPSVLHASRHFRHSAVFEYNLAQGVVCDWRESLRQFTNNGAHHQSHYAAAAAEREMARQSKTEHA